MLTISARCWLCLLPLHHSQQGICSYCQRHLPRLPLCCPRCGLPSADTTHQCGRCLQNPPPWQSMTFISDYAPPFNTLLKHFKFHGKTELAAVLARQLLLRWQMTYRERKLTGHVPLFRPDRLFTVPLHRNRQWRRGFNQTELLARPLARWLNCTYEPRELQRTRRTPLQQTLSASARRRNLRGAFSCDVSLSGQQVVLLDDVVTTGSTAAEISRLLLGQGAAGVQVWCLCRTL
ncbi:DNA utilization protein GntX [Pectobacterium carotovorum]|uniref:DNA utilization protein GntX n=1 Tax=Pectobacterium carotovorum TaxID=554 RepID=UPI0001A43A38|nr:DNA utilization protein GntX [Pectobacterium carotovorum]MBL0866462.1 DNA utilization protein GntX [Pectobacterium carotovorum]MCA6971745.1 DNA utilization protein GntX [Pectobacterium carotovorum]MCA6974076.1 DNA utilization protein GntX [Pectobacterium carotovorum]MDK9422578.1 DNA utilization protein GntX [Pectobacterium carotovorum]QHP52657.1 DNA utilization protein GntX [Pectobacterium carotovorum subsp. carotovorum]